MKRDYGYDVVFSQPYCFICLLDKEIKRARSKNCGLGWLITAGFSEFLSSDFLFFIEKFVKSVKLTG